MTGGVGVRRLRPLRGASLAAVGVVLLCAVLAVSLARVASSDMSVTTDEFGYLPDGLGWLSGETPRVLEGNPPLFKVLSAIPVVWVPHQYRSEWVREGQGFWRIGRLFMEANRDNYHELYLRARIVPLAFLAVTCLLAGWLGWQLYGKYAAAVAALLTALNPTMLAHGALVTPDIFFTASTLTLILILNAHVRRPSYLRAIATGAALAVACLFKLTGFLAVLIVWVWSLACRRQSGRADQPAWCRNRYRLVAAATLWIVLCAGYGFEGVGVRLRDVRVRSAPLTSVMRLIGAVPSPMPPHLVKTIDYQINDRNLVAYLDGRANTRGFFDYYVKALVYKTPLSLLGLLGLSVLAGRVQRKEQALLILGLGLLAFFSVLRFKNIGVRYVLFLYPLMAVWVGRLVADDVLGRWKSEPVVPRLRVVLVCLGIAAMAASERSIWPHHLAYFNLIAGGPEGGPRHLVDSNIDWGQDLILLKRFMESRAVDEVELVYFGRVDPSVYGVKSRALGSGPNQRWVAASVTVLFALSQFPGAPETYRQLLQLEPTSRLGYSIYVYDLADQRSGTAGR